MTEYQVPDIKSIIMNLDKVGTMVPIARGLQRAKFSEGFDMFGEMAYLQLSAYVLSEHLAADTVEESEYIPATWWDHFKFAVSDWSKEKPCRVLTSWWIRKHPPNFTELTLAATWTRNATRPQATIQVDDRLGQIVYQEQVTHSMWRSDDVPPR